MASGEGFNITSAFLTDPQEQMKIYHQLEELKASKDGWKNCVIALTNGSAVGDHVQFLCFQVIEHYLKTRYSEATQDECVQLRSFLSHLLSVLENSGVTGPPPFLKNKIAVLFSYVFLVDFSSRWPQFFEELFFARLPSGDLALFDVYLRVLIAIDSEVADVDIQRTKEECQRNAHLKDGMRERCVEQFVNSWLEILDAQTQEAAIDCLCSTLTKKMEPEPKLELITAMDQCFEQAGVFKVDQDTDEDLLLKLAELINCIGKELLEIWQKFQKAGNEAKASAVMEKIDAKMPLLIAFLGHESDAVSGPVADFAHSYVATLKLITPLSPERQRVVQQVLMAIIKKYRYPEEYNHEREAPNMILSAVDSIATEAIGNWKSCHYADVELAITLLYHLGEIAQINKNLQPGGQSEEAQLTRRLVKQLATSQVTQSLHVAVNLQYFETMIRFEKIFSLEPQLIPQTLLAFLDERGLKHQNGGVRSRCAFLFSKFIRSLKAHLHNDVDLLLTQLGPLLAGPPDETHPLLKPDDQLFLYEAVGNLIVCGKFDVEQKRQYMEQLMGDLWQKFSLALEYLVATSNKAQSSPGLGSGDHQQTCDTQARLFAYLNDVMAFASRISKAFSNQQTMKSCDCTPIFLKLTTCFLSALNGGQPPNRSPLLNGVRQYLHRMVLCLEGELLPFLPEVIAKFLQVIADVRSLQDFLILLQQVVSKYKKESVPWLTNNSGSIFDVYSGVWTLLGRVSPTDEDDIRDCMYLKRAYYQLIASAVCNGVLELIGGPGEDFRNQVMVTLHEGIKNTTDCTAQKLCLAILHKLTECAESTPGAREDDKKWLYACLYQQILPTCLLGFLRNKWDFADAQVALVVNEMVILLKKVQQYRGQTELAAFLSGTLQSDVSAEDCAKLISSVQNLELKPLQKTFRDRLKAIERKLCGLTYRGRSRKHLVGLKTYTRSARRKCKSALIRDVKRCLDLVGIRDGEITSVKISSNGVTEEIKLSNSTPDDEVTDQDIDYLNFMIYLKGAI